MGAGSRSGGTADAAVVSARQHAEWQVEAEGLFVSRPARGGMDQVRRGKAGNKNGVARALRYGVLGN
jgi:hypothetical protein